MRDANKVISTSSQEWNTWPNNNVEQPPEHNEPAGQISP